MGELLGSAEQPLHKTQHFGDRTVNGPEIFNFTVQAVPRSMDALLKRAGKTMDDIDLYAYPVESGSGHFSLPSRLSHA